MNIDLGSEYDLLEYLTAYQKPAIIMAAHRLGVFKALAGGPATLAELSEQVGAPRRSLGILVRACVALELLELEEDRYANGELVSRLLVPGRPGYIGRLVDKEYLFYQAWGNLADSVRMDQPALAPLPVRLRADPEPTRNFLEALDDIATLYGGAFMGTLALEGHETVLDVGGGVGSYAVALAKAHSDLKVTILELPTVVPWARDFIAQAGLAGRIDVVPLDFMAGPFPEGHDVVLFSNIFHDNPPTVNQGLLAKAYAALPAGGTVVAHEFLLDPDRVEPVASAVFAVMMLVENAGGNVYTAGEIEAWMETAGFEERTTRRFPDPSPMGLVRGRKA